MPIALSPTALTTVARVQIESGTSGDDEKLKALINAISASVERFCGRQFAHKRFLTSAPELHQGDGRPELYLRRWPIRAVEQVSLSGQVVTVESLSAATVIPLSGNTVFRTAEWDRIGMLYYRPGWPSWVPVHRDLSQAPNVDPAVRAYTVTVAYTGGYILPQYDGQENATYNPAPAQAADLPADLEAAVVSEVLLRLQRPNPALVEERTPGGWSQTWRSYQNAEPFLPQNQEIFLGYATPGVLFR